jgi:phosphoribosylglycinamide formyltransferase-1
LSKNSVHKIAIFASGKGSNAEALIKYFENSEAIQVGLIVTNNPKAGVIAIANSYEIPVQIISNEALQNPEQLLQTLLHFKTDYIVLAGFLRKIPDLLIQQFPNKIINIHPALLPKFGGKGMYGNKVHEAVLQAQEKATGITIHFVNEHYDEGQIIFQAETALTEHETTATISAKVQALEHEHFARVVEGVVLKNFSADN